MAESAALFVLANNREASMPWNRCYYNAVEHFLWTPQALSHQKHPKNPRTVRLTMERVRGLENPLNHIFEIFFALAPARFISKIIGEPRTVSDLVSVNSGDCASHVADTKSIYGNLCQPDLFFVGKGFRACIELKVKGGNSRLEQVIKYAALLHQYPHAQSVGGKKRLLLVGPTGFPDVWKPPGPKTTDELRAALAMYEDAKLSRTLIDYGITLTNAKAWVQDMEIVSFSYRQLDDLLADEEAGFAHGGQASEVYLKLLRGMRSELHARGYGDTAKNTKGGADEKLLTEDEIALALIDEVEGKNGPFGKEA